MLNYKISAKDLPLVSVIITVYNREKYLEEAIKSILASSFQDYEIIIVDDNSSDGSWNIIEKYGGADERIRIYRNEKNLGQFPNRNYAASLAKGKYIKYLDSDDFIYPHGLEVMVQSMESHTDAAFAIPGIPNAATKYPIRKSGREGLIYHFTRGGLFVFGPSAVIFQREKFLEAGGFGADNFVGNDEFVLVKLAANHDYLLINPSLIWWRSHEEQEMVLGLKSNDYERVGVSKRIEIIRDKNYPFTKTERRSAFRRLRNLYLGKVLRNLLHLKLLNALRLLILTLRKLYFNGNRKN